jgi:hypothetical protein
MKPTDGCAVATATGGCLGAIVVSDLARIREGQADDYLPYLLTQTGRLGAELNAAGAQDAISDSALHNVRTSMWSTYTRSRLTTWAPRSADRAHQTAAMSLGIPSSNARCSSPKDIASTCKYGSPGKATAYASGSSRSRYIVRCCSAA